MSESEEKRESKYAKFRGTLSELDINVRYAEEAPPETIDDEVETALQVKTAVNISRIKTCVMFLAILAGVGVLGGIILAIMMLF